jgi:hypothetical protein
LKRKEEIIRRKRGDDIQIPGAQTSTARAMETSSSLSLSNRKKKKNEEDKGAVLLIWLCVPQSLTFCRNSLNFYEISLATCCSAAALPPSPIVKGTTHGHLYHSPGAAAAATE